MAYGATVTLTTDLDALRILCQAMFGSIGLPVLSQQPQPAAVDLILGVTTFGTPQSVIARITLEPPTAERVAALASASRDEGLADYLLVSPVAATGDSPHVLAGDRLFEWLRRCWVLVDSAGDVLAVDRDAWVLMEQVNSRCWPAEADMLRVALAASRNTIPWGYEDVGTADDIFEQAVFRILTGVFALRGRRMGSASRGSRVGDALVGTTACRRPVLVDCKAARRGYRMDIDDERRLLEYAESECEWDGEVTTPCRVVVISSGFGEDPARSFTPRRRRFQDAGTDLSYLRVDDLIRVVLALPPTMRDDTEALARLDWGSVLGSGIAAVDDLLLTLEGVA